MVPKCTKELGVPGTVDTPPTSTISSINSTSTIAPHFSERVAAGISWHNGSLQSKVKIHSFGMLPEQTLGIPMPGYPNWNRTGIPVGFGGWIYLRCVTLFWFHGVQFCLFVKLVSLRDFEILQGSLIELPTTKKSHHECEAFHEARYPDSFLSSISLISRPSTSFSISPSAPPNASKILVQYPAHSTWSDKWPFKQLLFLSGTQGRGVHDTLQGLYRSMKNENNIPWGETFTQRSQD